MSMAFGPPDGSDVGDAMARIGFRVGGTMAMGFDGEAAGLSVVAAAASASAFETFTMNAVTTSATCCSNA